MRAPPIRTNPLHYHKGHAMNYVMHETKGCTPCCIACSDERGDKNPEFWKDEDGVWHYSDR